MCDFRLTHQPNSLVKIFGCEYFRLTHPSNSPVCSKAASISTQLIHQTLLCAGLAASQQHLLLGQKELVDEVSLGEQGVGEGALLRLVISLKGGPINARRTLPPEDVLWREVSDIMDERRLASLMHDKFAQTLVMRVMH